MSEQYQISWRGHSIRVINDHPAAAALLAAAGFNPPKIPAGCNTVLFSFTTAGGARALAVNQTGFAPTAKDDEREVNGCAVYVLAESLGSKPSDDAILEGFVRELMNS